MALEAKTDKEVRPLAGVTFASTKETDRADFLQAWVKRQAKGETDFAATLADFFKTQTRAIIAALRRHDVGTPADAIFRPADWEADLRTAGRAGIERLAVVGAVTEMDQHNAARNGRAKAPRVNVERLRLQLPEAVRNAIDGFLDDTMAQDWWNEINSRVRDDLAAALQAGVQAGDNLQQLADRVGDSLASAGQARAERIARTEATGSLNAGAEAVRESLAREGLIQGKEWLTVDDHVTRDSHRAANGQRVNAGERFTIGSETAAYPGDMALSPENRINCRCTCISITAESHAVGSKCPSIV